MPKLIERDQSIRFSGLDNAVEDGTGPGAVAGVREHPVFAVMETIP